MPIVPEHRIEPVGVELELRFVIVIVPEPDIGFEPGGGIGDLHAVSTVGFREVLTIFDPTVGVSALLLVGAAHRCHHPVLKVSFAESFFPL